MLKLMKYELRKTRMFFLVTVAIIAITELLFLIGYYGNFETPFVISMILAFLIFIGGFLRQWYSALCCITMTFRKNRAICSL